MRKTQTTHLLLPERVRRMAGMAAARTGQTLSDYISSLIAADGEKTGIGAFIGDHEPGSALGVKEVR